MTRSWCICPAKRRFAGTKPIRSSSVPGDGGLLGWKGYPRRQSEPLGGVRCSLREITPSPPSAAGAPSQQGNDFHKCRTSPRPAKGSHLAELPAGREISSVLLLLQFVPRRILADKQQIHIKTQPNFHGSARPLLQVSTEGLTEIRGGISCHGFLQCVLHGTVGHGRLIRESRVCVDDGRSYLQPAKRALLKARFAQPGKLQPAAARPRKVPFAALASSLPKPASSCSQDLHSSGPSL